jgi:hypothetical protein
MREAHSPFTIDDFEISSGQIYSSDQDLWHEKWKHHYLDSWPNYLSANDDIAFSDQKKITKAGVKYNPCLLKSPQAVRRRYIRAARECRDGIKRSIS